jgi:plasmid stabilization system protein ParE
MNNKLIFDPRATKEFIDSWYWYEQHQVGLGNKFEVAVYNKLEEIQQNPERYPKKRVSYRETKIKKFPFLIIYKFYKEETLITVFSIFHTSRNPKLKYKSID